MQCRITIGIPVFNEAKNIEKLLRSVCSVMGDAVEIIVLSSGSTDATDSIVRQFKGVTLVADTVRRGKIVAVKQLMTLANGEYIVLMDGDVALGPTTLLALLQQVNGPAFVAGTAFVRVQEKDRLLIEQLSEISCTAWHLTRQKAMAANGFVYPSGHLMVFRKNLLHPAELEEPTINDDALIGLLLEGKNVRFNYCEDIEVFIKPPATVMDFLQQKIRTRLGRRQLSKYSRTLKDAEQCWRSAVLAQRRRDNFPKVYLLLMLDFIARYIAAFQFKFTKRHRANSWTPVASTK